MAKVWVQAWDESEAGWGVRPDGYSLHLTREDLAAYVDQYWKEERARNTSGEVTHEYSRTSGSPYEVEVTEELYEQVKQAKLGIRLWQHEARLEESRRFVLRT